jgi:hypothetical protein
MMSFGVISDDTSRPFSFAMRARVAEVNIGVPPLSGGGNDLQGFRCERRVHPISPRGRNHTRLEFSEKLVHCGAQTTGFPAGATKIRGRLGAHRSFIVHVCRGDTVDGRTITFLLMPEHGGGSGPTSAVFIIGALLGHQQPPAECRRAGTCTT